MSDDTKALIALLRDMDFESWDDRPGESRATALDAADALEAVEARVKELEGLAKEYLNWDGGHGSECYDAGKSYDARKALRAALSTAHKEK
jgi:hypothetical protein